MSDLLAITLPVFLIVGAGYGAVWLKWMSAAVTEGLMKFSQGIAIPCLLFNAIAGLNLGTTLDPTMLGAYYTGSVLTFLVGGLVARFAFHRPVEDAVVIGLSCLFANSVLMGLPITERAFGPDALGPNYAIIAFHAPFCYAIGILTMETLRHRGQPLAITAKMTAKAIFSNALMIGILLGFAVNLTGLQLPAVAQEAVSKLASAALPVALFGLGGTLVQYRAEGDARVIALICALSLLLHPAIVYGLTGGLGLDAGPVRSAVITAAMAPGINSYIFAVHYGRAARVAASSVLIATVLSILSASAWLAVLP